MTAFLVCERENVRHAGRLAVFGVCSSQEDRGTTKMGSCLLWERTALDGREDTTEEDAVMEVGQLGSWTPRQLCSVKCCGLREGYLACGGVVVRRRSTLVCYQVLGLAQVMGFLPPRVITPGAVGLHPNLVFLGLRPRPTTSLFHLLLTREGMNG